MIEPLSDETKIDGCRIHGGPTGGVGSWNKVGSIHKECFDDGTLCLEMNK